MVTSDIRVMKKHHLSGVIVSAGWSIIYIYLLLSYQQRAVPKIKKNIKCASVSAGGNTLVNEVEEQQQLTTMSVSPPVIWSNHKILTEDGCKYFSWFDGSGFLLSQQMVTIKHQQHESIKSTPGQAAGYGGGVMMLEMFSWNTFVLFIALSHGFNTTDSLSVAAQCKSL